MKVIFTTVLLLVTTLLFAQSPGSLDTTFGVGGKVFTSVNSLVEKSYGVVIQTDGKLVVAGYATSSITGKDFICVRYNTNGSLDNTFGTGGIVTTDLQLGSDDIAYGLALQSDGKIVAAGYSDNGSNKDAALVRYNTDGTLDSTFGTNGKVLSDYDSLRQDEIKVVKIHPLTGNIIVGGASIISTNLAKPVVARYLSNGSLDTTFNHNGIRLLWVTSLDYQYLFSVEDLAVQPNGKISAVGWRDFPGLSWDSDYWLGRINNDGTMDITFSTDGVVFANGGFNGHDRAYSMILQPNNNILVSGGSYYSTIKYDYSLFEANSSGTIGGSIAGSVDYGSGLDDIAYGMAADMNGNYILGGSTGTATNKSFGISRMTSTGSLDNTFATGGKLTTSFGTTTMSECFDVLVQPDNKIVAVGYAGDDIVLARYLGTGVPQLNNFNLVSPALGAINQPYPSLMLDWTDAYMSSTYEMMIDTNATFTGNPQTYTSSVSGYVMNNLTINTKYYWKARCGDGTNWGNWSNVWNFTTSADYPVSVKEYTNDDRCIYPNPAHDFITIETSQRMQNCSFKLYDAVGKVVKIGALKGTSTKVIINDLVAGNYIIRFDDGLEKSYKFVKQ